MKINIASTVLPCAALFFFCGTSASKEAATSRNLRAIKASADDKDLPSSPNTKGNGYFACGDSLFCVTGKAICVDSSSCQCLAGRSGPRCEPYDECKVDTPCPTNAYCVDRFPPELYSCHCPEGFSSVLPEKATLTDPVPVDWRPIACIKNNSVIAAPQPVDPVTEAPIVPTPSPLAFGACLDSTDCPGIGFVCIASQCTCPVGTAKVGPNCQNENECQPNFPNNCHKYATCYDEAPPSFYSCQCQKGFRDKFPGVNKTGTVCEQENECLTGTHDCNADMTCLDRVPPLFWECIDPTPAPTNKPSPAPTPPLPARAPAPPPILLEPLIDLDFTVLKHRDSDICIGSSQVPPTANDPAIPVDCFSDSVVSITQILGEGSTATSFRFKTMNDLCLGISDDAGVGIEVAFVACTSTNGESLDWYYGEGPTIQFLGDPSQSDLFLTSDTNENSVSLGNNSDDATVWTLEGPNVLEVDGEGVCIAASSTAFPVAYDQAVVRPCNSAYVPTFAKDGISGLSQYRTANNLCLETGGAGAADPSKISFYPCELTVGQLFGWDGKALKVLGLLPVVILPGNFVGINTDDNPPANDTDWIYRPRLAA